MVLKFGGSSLADADRIRQVADIIQSSFKGGSTYVVVSAFGGITDLLIKATDYAELNDIKYVSCMNDFFSRTETIESSLLSKASIDHIESEFSTLKEELGHVLYGISLVQEASKKTRDYILSFGERISAQMLARYLKHIGHNSAFVDARDLIKTDDNFGEARVNFDLSYKLIARELGDKEGIHIITGFIGSDIESGRTTTLGRGGSDYSASIFAAALMVPELQIWTDVSGVLSCDPRKVPKAQTIPELNYHEALELSHFGAKVLYAPTVRPVREKNIPTRIKNTFDPAHPGTLIHSLKTSSSTPITGVSSIDDIALLCLQGAGLQGVTGTAARLFTVLAKNDINVILITQASSEHSICFAIKQEDALLAKSHIDEEFSFEIKRKLVDPVIIEDEMCLIATVGENMKNQVGLAGSLFKVLGHNGVNIEAIAQGSSELNISFAVSTKDQIKALNTIHDSFFLSERKTIHLFIVGTGLVGKRLLDMIHENHNSIAKENKLEIVINGISNSRKMLMSKSGIINYNDELMDNESCVPANLDQFVNFMLDCNFPNSVFVDNTSGLYITSYYETILSNSIAVSTPNKFALSSGLDQYKLLKATALKHSTSINFETNVGAALPVISTLNNLVRSGDKIQKIKAVLSGSLSYIFNTYDSSVPFSKLVGLAKEHGYTEPDPREDLSGNDVKRKLLILARESGYNTKDNEIKILSLFDESLMAAPDIKTFFSQLEQEDERLAGIYNKASLKGKRLSYLAEFENGKGQIGLKEIDKSSPFYNLSGSDNMIAFYTNRYNKTPLIIQGPGAGAEVTASGVLAEIINIGSK